MTFMNKHVHPSQLVSCNIFQQTINDNVCQAVVFWNGNKSLDQGKRLYDTTFWVGGKKEWEEDLDKAASKIGDNLDTLTYRYTNNTDAGSNSHVHLIVSWDNNLAESIQDNSRGQCCSLF